MIATPAQAPITMPAIAPPERDDEEEEDPVDDGVDVWVAVEGAVVESLEADVAVVVVIEDVVAVAAINDSGLKDQELADGDAELSDEYVSFSVSLLMFLRIS